MRHRYRQFLLSIFLLLLGISPLFSKSVVTTPLTTITLSSSVSQIEAGNPFFLMLDLRLKQGWHTYWKNPGDSGLPMTLDWDVPKGVFPQAALWPAPEIQRYGDFTNYGYKNHAYLLIPVKTDPSLSRTKPLRFSVSAKWLVCQETCIPDNATLSLSLPVGPEILSHKKALIDSRFNSLPPPLASPTHYTFSPDTLTISISPPPITSITDAYFFPEDPTLIDHHKAQVFTETSEKLRITLPSISDTVPDQLSGILKLVTSTKTYYRTVTATPVPSSSRFAQLLKQLLFAFIGGLILNLMPCVFPVLSLKALNLLEKARSSHREVMISGLAYTLGILITFITLASMLLVFKATGQALGWGFQLQSPVFVGLLLYLLFFVGLNLSGLVELPGHLLNMTSSVATQTDHLQRGSSFMNQFFTGVLATIVATPCTAPLMGTAIGYALTQGSLSALLIFTSLGLGMASPFLLLSFFPVLTRFLPKPGAWMVRFKQVLAIPMYLSCVWLAWVLVQQTGYASLIITSIGLSVSGLCIWVIKKWRKGPHLWVYIGVAILCLSPLYLLSTLPKLDSRTPNKQQRLVVIPFSKDTLESLIQEGRPVFVNATAAWCISCQVNKYTAIQTDPVIQLFTEKNIAYIEADWTNEDPNITNYLKTFGRNGVPLYVYYPPHKSPIVLPQILTKRRLIKVLKTAPSPK